METINIQIPVNPAINEVAEEIATLTRRVIEFFNRTDEKASVELMWHISSGVKDEENAYLRHLRLKTSERDVAVKVAGGFIKAGYHCYMCRYSSAYSDYTHVTISKRAQVWVENCGYKMR